MSKDDGSVRMIALNKGIRVGGPWDGDEYYVLIYPGDYPDDKPPPERSEVNRVFSTKFPEGAVYHWHAETKEWRYQGTMEDDGLPGDHREIFDAFGVDVNPPL